MVKITAGIEGMVCGMCEAHINEAVRKAFRVKKHTVILAEQDACKMEHAVSRILKREEQK